MSWYSKSQQEQISNLRSFLQNISSIIGPNPRGLYYSSLYDFIYKNGKLYQSSKLTDREMLELKEVLDSSDYYKQKECFFNAQKIAVNNLGINIKYVEGFLFDNKVPIPIEHAWNTINDKVLDFTCKHLNEGKPIIGVIPEGLEYIGVALSPKRIIKLWKDGVVEQIDHFSMT